MRVLLIEDERTLASQVAAALRETGFTVDVAHDGEEGGHLGAEEPYDAIVLDLGLPVVDGVSVLRGWRAAGVLTPVLILTARGEWRDRVEGLNAGGDDYLGKPFHMDELVARLRALIRRSNGGAQSVLRAGAVELDTIAGTVSVDGGRVTLTGHEYKLLSILMTRPREVHGKSGLAEALYGVYEDRESNTIEVFVARLRRKLGGGIVETVRGRGYRIGTG